VSLWQPKCSQAVEDREPARLRASLNQCVTGRRADLNAQLAENQVRENPIPSVGLHYHGTQIRVPNRVEERLRRREGFCGHCTFPA